MDQGEFVRMKRHVRRYSRVLLAARDLLQVEAAAMLELFWHVRELWRNSWDEVPRKLPTARAARAAGARDGAAGAAAAQTRNRRESGGNVGGAAVAAAKKRLSQEKAILHI